MSEMGNEEDEDAFEAEIPRVRVNPTSREKQEHEDSGHAVYRSWCAACVEGRGVGGQHRIELLEQQERERTTPIVAFDHCFLTQENADTFPILNCPRLQVWSNVRRHVVNGKDPQHTKILVFAESFEMRH